VERDVPLIRRLLAAVLLALAVAGVLRVALAADEARLVLVAAANSPVAPLSAAEVRRLYLGVPLVQNGRELIPLRNAASPAATEMFLQHVLFMSAQAYERQISARLYRSGGNRIPEHTDLRTLVEALVTEPFAVSYMPAETAARIPAVKILGDL